MKQRMKRIVHRILKYFGYRIAKTPTPNGTPLLSRSRDYQAARIWHRPVLVTVDAQRLRWKAGRIGYTLQHPFVLAVDRAHADPNPVDAIQKVLASYYRLAHPRAYSDIAEECAPQSRSMPRPSTSHVVFWPWEKEPIVETPVLTPVFVEDRLEMLPSQIHGVQHWGPVSESKLRTEVKKLDDLWRSVLRRGYRPVEYRAGGHIEGIVLRRANRWVVVVDQGQHRAAVLRALGWQHLDVVISDVIDFDDLEFYPLVADGTYDIDCARAILNAFIDGKPSPFLSKWVQTVSTELRSSGGQSVGPLG